MLGKFSKIEIQRIYPVFLVFTLIAHFLFFILLKTPDALKKNSAALPEKKALKIVSLGEKNKKSENSVYLRPDSLARPISPEQKSSPRKKLNLSDLAELEQSIQPSRPQVPPQVRPGKLPSSQSALSGLRYENEDFKKLAKDSMLQGGANILSSKRIALNFELPEGKKLDELNESELRLYGFLRRGAMKYMASLSSELKEFEMKNPHLHFPLTDSKQVLTGRLVYDSRGNVKQIKMVRWTHIDKLQGFFENVLKRLDTLQNPPKELWVENGEFTIFVTLQING